MHLWAVPVAGVVESTTATELFTAKIPSCRGPRVGESVQTGARTHRSISFKGAASDTIATAVIAVHFGTIVRFQTLYEATSGCLPNHELKIPGHFPGISRFSRYRITAVIQ